MLRKKFPIAIRRLDVSASYVKSFHIMPICICLNDMLKNRNHLSYHRLSEVTYDILPWPNFDRVPYLHLLNHAERRRTFGFLQITNVADFLFEMLRIFCSKCCGFLFEMLRIFVRNVEDFCSKCWGFLFEMLCIFCSKCCGFLFEMLRIFVQNVEDFLFEMLRIFIQNVENFLLRILNI